MSADDLSRDSFYTADYVDWKGWQKLFKTTALEAETFAAELSKVPLRDRRVLEIGFGAGAFMAWARQQGAQITGCELIEKLCAVGIEQGFDARFGGVDSIAPQDAAFDLIVAFDVMEHVPSDHLPGFMRAVRQRLASDGLFLARMPNGASPWGLINQYGDLSHTTVLSPGRLQQLAEQTGFVLQSCRNAARVRPDGEGLLKWKIRTIARDALHRLVCTAFGWWQVPLDPNIVARFRPRA